ncbi:dihydroorotate dehydrogenase, partial [Erwinia amylovora]|nr:dihydroorotate dehydrogenase [Erwinia amylovora]
ASAITLSDTIPGLAFDLVEGKAVLGGVCGYSGPGIKPRVLAALCELRQRGVSVPIMGSGGVQSGQDVHEDMLAGAETVQVYSALHQGMFTTLERI